MRLYESQAWICSVLDEGAESINVGRTAERTAKRSVVAATEEKQKFGNTEARRTRGIAVAVAEEGEREKWRTTCRNNVRVFDLGHVTEPH